MKTLVVFDSEFGNTQKIAEAIGAGLDGAEVRYVGQVQPGDLAGLDCLVVGSPTQRMNYIEGVRDFLDRIPQNGLDGVKVAAFDTRISNEDMRAQVTSRITKFVVRTMLHRFAAGPIASVLAKKGGTVVIDPEGFYVAGTEGPLKDGELARATAWARTIAEQVAGT